MKKLFLLLIFAFLIHKSAFAQILCINCYNQNDSISDNVNNLILNGGFENTTCLPGVFTSVYCPNSNNYSCDILNWTCTGGGILTYAHMYDTSSNSLSIIPEGIQAPYFGNEYCEACSNIPNDTSCLISILCTTLVPPLGYPSNDIWYGGTTGVSLEQMVNGLVIGNTYVLEFWSGGESPGSSSPCDGLFSVDIGFGKTFLRDPTTFPVTGVGRTYVIQWNATSTSHTFKFTNWGHILHECTELVLDNVRLYTLAELDVSVPHCFLGVDNINDDFDFTITPNPFTDYFELRILNFEMEKNTELKMFDVFGKEILSQPIRNSKSEIRNLHHLAKGIYFIKLTGEKINVVKKLVKE